MQSVPLGHSFPSPCNQMISIRKQRKNSMYVAATAIKLHRIPKTKVLYNQKPVQEIAEAFSPFASFALHPHLLPADRVTE